ncbi:AAA domain-containing protein [Streptosporangium sp. NPDC006007]|uniref:AAA domain-containing protein n=1 Tax=Streptosporangium sp. NPDC006007 TaxID=3154575 RepID=UPI0033B8B774
MSPLNDQRARVVRYWRACEFFSPQSVPKPSPRDALTPVFDVSPGRPLPWQRGHELRARTIRPGFTWRHTLYGGIFKQDRVRAFLEHTFGADPEGFDASSADSSALFSLTILDEGRALFGSEVFSSCAWATERTLHRGPAQHDWLDGFEEACGAASAELESAIHAYKDDARAAELLKRGHRVSRPLDYGDLAALLDLASERIGAEKVLSPEGLMVKSVQVSKKREFLVDDGADFLNSFIIGDLRRVSEVIRGGRYGAALDAYMRTAEPERIDVRKRPQVVFDGVAPDLVPLGRWPQAKEVPLALSQQFAVNSVMAGLARGSGMFAVNGPPGTGKTTMLRDLIAAIVVERAHRLSRLADPRQAFTGTHQWMTGDYTRVVRAWRENLTGFEIVVASANNGAVQNVTLEIPGRDAFLPPWRDGTDYFADIGGRVLGQPAWGLGAARLGRKSYRQGFIDKAWFSLPATPPATEPTPEQRGLMDVLKHWEREALKNDTDGWAEAVARFTRAYGRARELQDERAGILLDQRAISRLSREIDEASRELPGFEKDLAFDRRRLAAAEADFMAARREIDQWLRKRQRHQTFQPSLITAIFTLGKATRVWHEEDRILAQGMDAAEEKAGQVGEVAMAIQRQIAGVSARLDAVHARLARLRDDVAERRRRLAPLLSALGGFVPDDDWWADDSVREYSAPWIDPQWNAARTDLFAEALRLHQAFLRAQAGTMRRNLQGAMDVLAGAVPKHVKEDAIRAAWQSFFFVVPVVSTTFSSIDRMFPQLTQEALGWLFIDEAGQATPQAAAGAIWRSRRVVVVGDPLQLEPVVPLPFTALEALRRAFQVPESRWVPGLTSVQQLADHTNVYGTYVPTDGEPSWVGAPLRVHRRCDQPMFGISNKIAYDGLMVYGKRPGEPLEWPTSAWIDVSGADAEGHWIPQEGKALAWVLNGLVNVYGVDPGQIMVIAPFREVVRGAARHAAPHRKVRVGTVHTAQGKEADVVILILGGDPGRPGAKNWAARRPNLLNVAVSRARRRLYVIGDRAEWSRRRHFDVLAANLETRPYSQ